MTPRLAPPALALLLALVPVALAACGGEVVFVEDGDDGAGLSGPGGDGPDGPDGQIDQACRGLCALPCAGGGQPGCEQQCAAGAPPGCEAEYADLLSCMFGDISRIDPDTCEGIGLCIEEAGRIASCGGFTDDGGGPF